MGAVGGQPDPDSIKMFVGQIPRHWNESDLINIFEEFGPIYQISVLRDKMTQQSRECMHQFDYSMVACVGTAIHNLGHISQGLVSEDSYLSSISSNEIERFLFRF
ncbi:RRM domain-containing protein [Caerostris extrusa]|uniref:RRM domain-containing protein n=1 Tax=Caerostris extrusa TaxID=172846 RepID=A0AAV4SZX6_CAEEX|nr:RRM domain-containing protein [Caerostris extrusa]